MSKSKAGVPLQQRTLDNGLTVICAPSRGLPWTALRLDVFAGAANVPEGQSALPALTVSSLRAAVSAAHPTAPELSADAELERTSLSVAVPSDATQAALAALFAAVTAKASSGFPTAKAELAAALAYAANDAGTLADRLLRQTAYGAGHPYARSVTGEPDEIERTKGRDVDAFAAAQFAPNNAVLVCAGDLGLEELLQALKPTLAKWRGRATPSALPPPPPAPPPLSDATLRFAPVPEHEGHEWGFAWPLPAAASDELHAYKLCESLFAGGFSSRLLQRLRVKEGLVYNLTPTFEANRSGGALFVRCACTPASSARLVQVVAEEAQRAAETGFTREELTVARDFRYGIDAFAIERSTELASALGQRAVLRLPPLQNTLELLANDATTEAVARAARAAFGAGPAAAVVGPPPQPLLRSTRSAGRAPSRARRGPRARATET